MTKDCAFCDIVAGRLKVDIKYQDDEIIVFPDIDPLAQVHYQVIPKKHIDNIDSLTPLDLPLVEKMYAVGQEILSREVALLENKLTFHRPPFNSVHHLHMHTMGLPFSGCVGIFKHSSFFFWSVPAQDVIHGLKNKS
jgi:diadenosine tetraphosphate (Ap4A) HIT family hydrolase